MVAQLPSQSNVFIPNHAASRNLVVDFSRNVKDFPINSYIQLVPVDNVIGYFLRMTIEEAGRMMTSDAREFEWPDGAKAPDDFDGTESFEYFPFRSVRRKYGFAMGDLTVDQATWQIVAQHAKIKAQQAMTVRTALAITVFTTSGNYDASHAIDVTAVSGNTGRWGASTTARQDIKRTLRTAAEIILDDTLSAVKPEDFRLVISSNCAGIISESQEIVDHIKGSPDALAQVRGELPNRNVLHGLPQRLYGYEVIVEDTRKVTSAKGATRATSKLLPDATPFMCARPGGLEGLYGAPSFSTVTQFTQEEMTTETMHDVNDRRTRGRIVDNFVPVMTAPAAGILFSNAV